MKTETFLDVMNELPDDLILDAGTVREKHVPRSRRILRTALIAAVLTLLLSVTAYAAGGGLAGYVSSTRPGAVWTTLGAIPRAERKLGVTITVPERFENGFVFQQMDLHYTDVTDEEGRVKESFPELVTRYERERMKVTLNVNRARPQPHEKGWTERECGDVSVWCQSQTYKVVPEDYQPTEEDRARQQSGELTISWGSDRVELLDTSFVQFVMDGADYLLMSMDGLSTDELFAMAEEIIRDGKA